MTNDSRLFGASLLRVGRGDHTYVETCCEPAAGNIAMVDNSGSIAGGAVG